MTHIPQPSPRPVVVPVSGAAMNSNDPARYRSPIDVAFVYDVGQPFSVVIDLAAPSGHGYEEDGRFARWTVSREVLHIGAVWQSPSGSCDFITMPVNDECIELRFYVTNNTPCTHEPPCHPPGSYLSVVLPRGDLLRFLDLSVRAVPIGRESHYLDIDSGLAALLAR